MEPLKNTSINKSTIKLGDGKQLFYGPIYALSPIELKILKTYIKTHLKTGFIWPFKSLACARILFDKKLDVSFHLCGDYWGFNNLIMKNWYPFSLIRKSLNLLDWAKRFTQLNLTSTFHQMRILRNQ